MKNINWWKVLNWLLHIATLGFAKIQTIVAEKAEVKQRALESK